MYVDELNEAVTKVGTLLQEADVRGAVDYFRASKGEQRKTATVKLAKAGAVMVERMASMKNSEKLLVRSLSLQSLGTQDYWVELTSANADPKKQQAEVVRLASRVVFATNHLPALARLLNETKEREPQLDAVSNLRAGKGAQPSAIGPDEAALSIRLTDAGERAADPDRIARAVDGIDMLYSACASIVRKPTIDLRLDDITAKPNKDRDFRFAGAKESIGAVFAVIDSIPAALADIDPERDIDLDAVVQSLPIFQDLRKLASLGTFSSKDLKDISETMHQGAMLTLESGVILNSEGTGGKFSGMVGKSSQSGDVPPTLVSRTSADMSAADYDEDYQRYLREREALQRSQAEPVIEGVTRHTDAGQTDENDTRRAAIDQLLKSLGRSKD